MKRPCSGIVPQARDCWCSAGQESPWPPHSIVHSRGVVPFYELHDPCPAATDDSCTLSCGLNWPATDSPQQANLSPLADEAFTSWNPFLGWPRRLDELRTAAWFKSGWHAPSHTQCPQHFAGIPLNARKYRRG